MTPKDPRLELLELAFAYYGMKEVPGKEHNPTIVEMFRTIGHAWVDNDETPWCACYVNFCLHMAGLAQTGRLNARSFRDYGQETDMPRVGDIVVLSRGPNPAHGHVGFFINESEDGEHIYMLGGNQSNQVNIGKYSKQRLLNYRRVV